MCLTTEMRTVAAVLAPARYLQCVLPPYAPVETLQHVIGTTYFCKCKSNCCGSFLSRLAYSLLLCPRPPPFDLMFCRGVQPGQYQHLLETQGTWEKKTITSSSYLIVFRVHRQHPKHTLNCMRAHVCLSPCFIGVCPSSPIPFLAHPHKSLPSSFNPYTCSTRG